MAYDPLLPQQRRDRDAAATPRYGYRPAVPLQQVVQGLMNSEQMRRIRRQRHLAAALAEVLSDNELRHVRPQRFTSRALVLGIDSSALLAELRQFRYHELVAACSRHGLGVSQVRLVRQREGSDK